MFTDMAGYTALMQEDEVLAVAKRDRYMDALTRQHEVFGGMIVQRLGDGSMSMFPSSLAAVQAAVAIQHELVPAGVAARIGIHVGEVVVEPERLTGRPSILPPGSSRLPSRAECCCPMLPMRSSTIAASSTSSRWGGSG